MPRAWLAETTRGSPRPEQGIRGDRHRDSRDPFCGDENHAFSMRA